MPDPLIGKLRNRKLRFCMITTFYPPYNFGGDGIFVHRLSNELARRGHDVEVIHCIDAYRSLSHDDPKSTASEHPRVIVHALRSPYGPLSPFVTQQTGLPLLKASRIRAILAKGFDVIHYHNASLIGGPGILSFGSGIKLYTMHEYWLVCPTHMLLKYNREPCVKPNCLLCTFAHRRPPQWWRYTNLLKKAVKHVDAFIAPSRFSKERHDKALGLSTVYLPNFVPASDTSRPDVQSGAAPPKPYFLFVGRLESLKGPQTLIPVFRHYSKAELWIAGSGNYESHLRELAASSENIKFLGRQTDEQLKIMYRDALAVIVPSLFYENFPLVTIEAFRQRTPIIVKNLGGLPEIVRDSGGGFVYDTEDELKAAIERLVTNPHLRSELGECGYHEYERKWTPEAHLARYFELIEGIAATRQSQNVEKTTETSKAL